MDNTQLHNLLTFSIMFHKVCTDTYVVKTDIDYIWDKYNKMIGFDPIIRSDEFSDWWQSVVVFVDDYRVMSLKAEWMDIWNRDGEKLDPKKERVLNYLLRVNTMSSDGPGYMSLRAATAGPDKIFKLFKEYIGDVDNICKVKYTHIHPNLEEFIDRYIKEFARELNLEILI